VYSICTALNSKKKLIRLNTKRKWFLIKSGRYTELNCKTYYGVWQMRIASMGYSVNDFIWDGIQFNFRQELLVYITSHCWSYSRLNANEICGAITVIRLARTLRWLFDDPINQTPAMPALYKYITHGLEAIFPDIFV